jgi:predicted GNAT family acetyltransferase/glutaredoxin
VTVTLYQAEWCPFSSAVRQALTELGIDAVIRQVEPWPEQRNDLREIAGTDHIPVLQDEDGDIHRGIHEIFAHLHKRDGWEHASEHRRRFRDHRDARESDASGRLLARFRGDDGLDPAEPQSTPDDATVVEVPEDNRYDLVLDGRRIALLAYHRRANRIALTHTEVSPACEGRGFGSALVKAVLDDARKRDLVVAPLCPFTAEYIRRHPEYADLVAPEHSRRLS